jgi:hypothetical protein
MALMFVSRNLLLIGLIGTGLTLSAWADGKHWVEVRSPHFRVLTDGSAGQASSVAREFEHMRAAFAAQFPGFRLESGAQLTILAPRDERQLKELTPRNWKGATIIPTGYFQHGWDKEYAVVRLDQVGGDRPTPDT